jgi:8-oxo-dGTP diphosphatase
MEEMRPKVGVGVVVRKDGKRKNAHGDGSRSFPGGHLEFREEVEDCARRETMEETNLTIKNIRMGPFTNDIFEKENKHYITVYAISDYSSGELKNMEPHKCEERK